MYAITAAVKTRFGHVLFLAHFMAKVAQMGYGRRHEAVWRLSASHKRFFARSRGIRASVGIKTWFCHKQQHAIIRLHSGIQSVHSDTVSGLKAFCSIPELRCNASQRIKNRTKIFRIVCQFHTKIRVFHSFSLLFTVRFIVLVPAASSTERGLPWAWAYGVSGFRRVLFKSKVTCSRQQCGALIRQMVGCFGAWFPPCGRNRKANGAGPRRASTADHPTLPRAATVVNPRARVRARSVHRGCFLVRVNPCALYREPISRAHSLHGLATPRPVAAGLHRGVFRCEAGKEKPRGGSVTPRL